MSPLHAVAHTTITTSDGYGLQGLEFKPTKRPVNARVLICSAIGTPKEYYEYFAAWLAEEGYATLAFDVRGYQERNDPAALRALNVDLSTIGAVDITAAIAHQKSRSPDLPLFVIAHSMGGHLLGLAKNHSDIDAVTTVTSGSGYWLHWPLSQSLRLGIVWYLAAPLLSSLYGYFPAKKLGWTTNMPKGVALEWARWARHPDYMLDREGVSYKSQGGFRHFERPILSLSFTDDVVMSESAIEALHGLYTAAEVTRRHLNPNELGLDRIDHFGFFRPSHAALWPLAIQNSLPSETGGSKAHNPGGRGVLTGVASQNSGATSSRKT